MRIDLHVHTWHSRDGVSPPAKIIKEVMVKGRVDGIAVTDHAHVRAWKEFKKAPFPVVFGEEVKSTSGDMLCLFITEEVKAREPAEVIDEVHSQGGLVIIPHPFDLLRNGFTELEKFKKEIDAVETLNSRSKSPFANKKADKFAESNKLPKTGGSDAHCRFEIGNAYTYATAYSLEEFRKAIEKGRTQPMGGLTPFFLLPVPSIAMKGIIGRAPSAGGSASRAGKLRSR